MIRVLFVVDDPASLIEMRHSLLPMRTEWDMKFFHTAEEAMVAMSETTFDVVVTDIGGDGIRGSELLALVQYQFPRVVRVLLAGEDEADAVAKSAGVAHRILPRPCETLALVAAVTRVVSLEQRLNDPDLQYIIGEVGELPRPSQTVVKLNDVVNGDDPTVEAVSNIIATDINMSAKVLQVVNSAFYGLSHHVVDIHEAVAYLGIDAVRDLVIADEMLREFQSVPAIAQSVVDDLHDHAVAVACTARELANDRQTASSAYIAALLHDVGLLLIASRMPEKLLELRVQAMHSSLPLREIEVEIFGAHHADLGAHLLDMWGLPQEIVEAVACHHEAPDIDSDEIDALHALHIADIMVAQREENDVASWRCASEADQDYLERMGVAEKVNAEADTPA